MSLMRVEYDTLGKMSDGAIGNIPQGRHFVYTNASLKDIEEEINRMLEIQKRNQVCVIIETKRLEGQVLAVVENEGI